MLRNRLNVWVPGQTMSGVSEFAKTRNLTLTQAVTTLLDDAIARQTDGAFDPAMLDAVHTKIGTLVDRTYYLIIATNVMLKHHPNLDLKQMVDGIMKDRKAASNG